MAMKRAPALFDKTKHPHKVYQYTFMPDPRKLAPIETVAPEEIEPKVIRPPHSWVPDVETFLDRIDVDELRPASDYKSSFTGWNDLMTASVAEMMSRGIPSKTAKWIDGWVRRYHKGELPMDHKRQAERQYWRQFNNKDNGQFRVPELPEKYRPHQMGEESQPIPNYSEINEMPEWAAKEEERLKAKGVRTPTFDA